MTVVAFKDSTIPGEPNLSLVDELKQLLADAESGNIRAMAYCTLRTDGSKETGWDGGYGTQDGLSACISILNHRYAAALLRKDGLE